MPVRSKRSFSSTTGQTKATVAPSTAAIMPISGSTLAPAPMATCSFRTMKPGPVMAVASRPWVAAACACRHRWCSTMTTMASVRPTTAARSRSWPTRPPPPSFSRRAGMAVDAASLSPAVSPSSTVVAFIWPAGVYRRRSTGCRWARPAHRIARFQGRAATSPSSIRPTWSCAMPNSLTRTPSLSRNARVVHCMPTSVRP